MSAGSQFNPMSIQSNVQTERHFNHDLLIDTEAQQRARTLWPTIAHALQDVELIRAFHPHEARSIKYKRMTQWLGTSAVLLMFVALLGSVAELGDSGAGERNAWISRLIEACAVLGLIIAIIASRFGPVRRRWLRHRFVAELLRQLHFRGILDGSLDLPVADFEAQRHRRLQSLLQDISGSVGQKMDRLIECFDDPLGAVPQPKLPADSHKRRELLDAYHMLRLDHQIDYAIYKLSPEDTTLLKLSNKALVTVTDLLAGSTLMMALGLSMIQIVSPMSWLTLMSVSLAVTGVAVRAWRDGLSLSEERERTQEMRQRLEVLRSHWHAASNDDDRWRVAMLVEEAAVEELRAFLRSNERAQFLF